MMRIVSYNIHFGGKGQEILSAKMLHPVNPDLIILQEATNPHVVESLARKLEMPFWGARKGYSLALLSRLPVTHATTLTETQRRYQTESSRVQSKIDLFLWGANTYRSSGMRCHAGCSNPVSGAGSLIESLVVAHTDPRTSGNTWFIRTISNAPDWLSAAFQFGPPTIETP